MFCFLLHRKNKGIMLNQLLIVPVNKIESFSVDLALLLATLCFVAFIYFAFLMPENGLPAVLFY